MLANKKLVYDFFENFSRFECAMKLDQRFCGKDSYRQAVPNWKALKLVFGPRLRNPRNKELEKAIVYLLSKPPKVQFNRNNVPIFQDSILRGATDGEKVLEAAKRVRNNLFHGGKHTGLPVEEERNDRLLRYALLVIEETSKIDPQFHMTFKGLV